MFSFIKWITAQFEKFKKNKGLWFTTLTVISLIGIFASLYFVNFLVGDVAKKTYENQKTHYLSHIKNHITIQKELVLATTSTITTNGLAIELFKSSDGNKSKKLKQLSSAITNKINSSTATKDYNVDFIVQDKLTNFKPKSGLNVYEDGLYFTSIMPMAETNSSRMIVELKKDAKSMINLYKKENLEWAYFLNDASINKIYLKNKKKNFTKFYEKFYIDNSAFDSTFIGHIKTLDMKEFLKIGYAKDSEYFFVTKPIYDFDGNDIGIVIIGEHTSEKNSFVNLIKNLVNSVTLVALGLIVSMILFLF